jgi:TrmH family RNA methyltransferase
MRREITGFSNPLIKRVRSLREKKHRKRENKFIAEGLRILTEAREAGFIPAKKSIPSPPYYAMP